ncbi:DNA recombination protein RmuC [Corticimicrobacter populi]|uniref:DNA recombination protein RmuC n=1 Tax=Corticimicrobacter populi TaxID=2175229 RepID=A0A2V1K5A0_9BURK|nr:DNA recombination protein RmuC [Corticimicrobacter populi]PWF25413.1 DNA recombination protein RmuC [Corticimicrobacter populi]
MQPESWLPLLPLILAAAALLVLIVVLPRAFAALRRDLVQEAAAARQEHAESLSRFTRDLTLQLHTLTESTERRMLDTRQAITQELRDIRTENAARLEEMRKTVDERLHATLEQRLGESFRLVSERLDAVHKGLGEMQSLAAGVGDLKRVLTNVKSRGIWGEVQLARLLEDTMTGGQYEANVKPVPGSDAVVEFAIRLPGGTDGQGPVWLPIDAKFPKEEYERLMQAQEEGDQEAVRQCAQALGRALEVQAKLIASRYIAPPHTTDFAVMFLPTEGLYAEALRLPGMADRLQRLRINLAGPTTLAALLNSLQMGFRTLAIEQRSSEVWGMLRTVKSEFLKFGDALASVRKTLETASNKIGQTETRARVMLSSLKAVEVLPDAQQDHTATEETDDASPPL